MTLELRRQLGIGLTALVGIAGVIFQLHDTPLLVAMVAGAGMLWTRRQLGPLLFVAGLVGAGLFWSSLDWSRCSLFWRGRVVQAKLAGSIPQLGWGDVINSAVSRCAVEPRFPEAITRSVQRLQEKTVQGRRLELYRTSLGEFWIPAPGAGLIQYMLWEITVRTDYESADVTLHSGDVVIDCGAHVGLFTRYALTRGAKRVIAIEPDPTNLFCLETNLAQEIAAGRVTVVKAGVWDHKTRLPLATPEPNSGASTFVFFADSQGVQKVEGIPVSPLDEIVEELRLEQVDFIKMDIEGSERRALRGSVNTIKRFKPKLVISSYHLPDDPAVVFGIVQEARHDYQVHAKGVDMRWGHVNPKVLFFN